MNPGRSAWAHCVTGSICLSKGSLFSSRSAGRFPLRCGSAGTGAAGGAVASAGALAGASVADHAADRQSDRQAHHGEDCDIDQIGREPRGHDGHPLYYRVVVFSDPLQGHVLHCKGCCGLVNNSYRLTVPERLRPQPFADLLIS